MIRMNFNIIIYAYLVLQLSIRDKLICVFFQIKRFGVCTRWKGYTMIFDQHWMVYSLLKINRISIFDVLKERKFISIHFVFLNNSCFQIPSCLSHTCLWSSAIL